MSAFEVCGSGLGVTDIGVSIRRRWWCVLPISVRGGICSLVPYGFAYSVQNLRSLPMPLDFSRHGLRTLPEVSNISPLPTGEGLAKEEGITLEGEVVEALPNARFKVKIGDAVAKGQPIAEIFCHNNKAKHASSLVSASIGTLPVPTEAPKLIVDRFE